MNHHADRMSKKVKKKKLYAKRFVQANLFLFPLLLIAPTAYQLTLPERAPLPYNATDVFDQQLDELNHLTRTKINIKCLYCNNSSNWLKPKFD